MKIISSQRFLDFEIVDNKIEEMVTNNIKKIVLPIIDAEITDLDSDPLYILIDGHHRKEAAEEIGIEIEYAETENCYELTEDSLLTACWIDSDWYYIETGIAVW